MADSTYVAYVGTYTHETSVGIYVYDVNPDQYDDSRTEADDIHAAADRQAHGRGDPKAGGRRQAADAVLLLEDDAAAQESDTRNDTRRDPCGIEACRTGKAVLGNDHEQGGADGHQHMRADAGTLGTVLPFETDGGADQGCSGQTDD